MPTTYQVKQGDTLSRIAANLGVSITDLSGYRSGDPNRIFAGETLTVGNAAPVQQSGPRDVQFGGDTGIAFNSTSQSQPQTSPYQQFGTALMGLLSRSQKMGTAGFARQGFDAAELQNKRISSQTPANLIGASPETQNAVRSASAGAVSPTIRSAANSQQTFGEQLGSFKDAVSEARNYLKEQQAIEESNRARAASIVELAISQGSTALDELLKTSPDVFKRAGYNTKEFDAVLKGLKAKEAEDLRRFNIKEGGGSGGSGGGGFSLNIPGMTGGASTPSVSYEQWVRPFLQSAEGQALARKVGGDNIALAKEARAVYERQFGSPAVAGKGQQSAQNVQLMASNLRSLVAKTGPAAVIFDRALQTAASQGQESLSAFVRSQYINNVLTGAERTDFNNVNNGIANYNAAIAFLKANPDIKTGFYKESTEGLKPKFGIGKDPRYTTLLNFINQAEAPIRKSLYGSALTPQELDIATRSLLNTDDDYQNILNKMQQNVQVYQAGLDRNMAGALGTPFQEPQYNDLGGANAKVNDPLGIR